MRAAKTERDLWKAAQDAQDRAADRITAFAGSMSFVYIHAVWFGLWLALNLGLLGAAVAFDEFPFGLLTMIVSLEAIFLATFVMVSQNRQAARDEIRAELMFEAAVHDDVIDEQVAAALNRLGTFHGLGRLIDLDAVEAEVTRRISAAKGLDTGTHQV